MRCPYCHSKQTKVIETRESEDLTRRRRECSKCSERFTTYEKLNSLDITVVKKSLARQPYNGEKLKEGILKACKNRPVSPLDISRIIGEIEYILRPRQEVKSKEIGEIVMEKLKALDEVSYLRFASVYRKFNDLNSFEKELKKLQEKKEGIENAKISV